MRALRADRVWAWATVDAGATAGGLVEWDAPTVIRTMLGRVHNPRNRECGCDEDCWCRRTALGRAVKWWLPSRPLGPHHKASGLADWKRSQDRHI